MSANNAEYALHSPPTDGITRLRYGKTNSKAINGHALRSTEILAVSSWDKTLRLYDTSSNQQLACIQHHSSVLDCVFNTTATNQKQPNAATYIYTACLDGSVYATDLATATCTLVHQQHTAGVRCIVYSSEHNLIISGGWDGQLIAVDTRTTPRPTADNVVSTTTHPHNSKIYAMDLIDHTSQKPRLVVGLNNRQVYIYDIRKLHQAEQIRESSLVNQTRSICCMLNGAGYILSSIEGRVSVEWFDPSPETQSQKYAFKCHRQPSKAAGDPSVYVYPVNCVIMHPVYHTFLTAGCDGQINVWDVRAKKRICQYPPYATSISSIAFNAAGDQLAVAVSYTYESGEMEDAPADAVYIRRVGQHEIMPKTK